MEKSVGNEMEMGVIPVVMVPDFHMSISNRL